MNKTIYNYHPETKIYVGNGEARLCPRNKIDLIIPAHATQKPLPEYDNQTQVCKFLNGDWVVEDIPVEVLKTVYEEIIEDAPNYNPLFEELEQLEPVLEDNKLITRFNVKPKENLVIDEVKGILIAQAKQLITQQISEKIGWQVERKVATGVDIKEEDLVFRQARVDAFNQYEVMVNAAQTIEELQAIPEI
jgi:hypothetical protein